MDQVRVRMYRQGLGDCFLLSFPGRPRPVHVLVDCGVLLGTEDANGAMRRVAENIRAETEGVLDALVVTHEHWDHASGFLQAKEIFDLLEVKQVWLSWAENPRDELAGQLLKKRARALAAVTAAHQRLRGMQGAAAARTAARVGGVLDFFGGPFEAARKTISAAMEWARARPGADRQFLRPGGEPFSIPGTSSVRVYVLGPPRDPQRIRKSDPSKRASEVYELAGEGGPELGFLEAAQRADGALDAARPFEDWFRVPEGEARARPFFVDHYGFDSSADDWRRIESDWLGAAGPLALRLDSDTNNTSLVLAFELLPSGRVLLFPGDAQVGNWLSWEDVTWKVPAREGAPRVVTSRDLLERTVLYKVGHHGSHNATLREKGLELMTSEELAAMLPVKRAMAEKQDWNMPFPSLYRRLEERTQGRILDADEGVNGRGTPLAAGPWKAFEERTAVKDDWIDYRIDP
jgi:hypothetical protein